MIFGVSLDARRIILPPGFCAVRSLRALARRGRAPRHPSTTALPTNGRGAEAQPSKGTSKRISIFAESVGDMFCGCGVPNSAPSTARGAGSGVRRRPISRTDPRGGDQAACSRYAHNNASSPNESLEGQNEWDASHPWIVALDKPTPLSPRNGAPANTCEDEYADLPAMVEHAIKRQMAGKRMLQSSVATRLNLLKQPDGDHLLFNVKVVDVDPRAQ